MVVAELEERTKHAQAGARIGTPAAATSDPDLDPSTLTETAEAEGDEAEGEALAVVPPRPQPARRRHRRLRPGSAPDEVRAVDPAHFERSASRPAYPGGAGSLPGSRVRQRWAQLVGVGAQRAAVGLRVHVRRRLEGRPDEVGHGLALLTEVGLDRARGA